MNIVSRKMDLNKIPALKTIYWKVTDGYVVVDSSKGHFILNNSSSLVWRCIDGCKTISDIINEIYEEHSRENTLTYVEEIVCEAISEYLDKDLILLREEDDLDGWLQYE